MRGKGRVEDLELGYFYTPFLHLEDNIDTKRCLWEHENESRTFDFRE
jgi:hypothetical protein